MRRHNSRHLSFENYFPVDILTDIIQHRAIILTSSTTQIGIESVCCDAIHTHNIVIRVDSHTSQYISASPSCHLYLLPLFFSKADTHSIHKNHIIVVYVVKTINTKFLNTYKRIIICLANLTERGCLIIDKCDTCA